MNTTSERLLFWAPRILAILFALFVSLFALDVFSEGYGFGEMMLALLMHMIPTILVVIALIVAWRWSWIGAVLFVGLAIFYLVMSKGGSWVISGPLLLTGALFLLDWLFRVRPQEHSQK